MNISILNDIKQWAKENNCPFRNVNYKIDKNFPKAFKDVINSYMHLARFTEEKLDDITDFNIVFTEDKNVYLEFLCDRTRVIIIDDYDKYDFLPPAKVVKEGYFLKDLKHLDSMYIEQFISTLPEEYARRFKETLTLEDMTKKITKNITEYIDYLIKEKNKTIETIYYQEANAATNIQTQQPSNKNNERKHDEIPFELRKHVLDKFESEYEFDAQASNTKSSYSVKVYKVKNIKYKIIMEPKEGNKYTKVVHLNKDLLSLGEARNIVIDSLQLDRDQISQTPNITRHSHTNLEEFKKLIEYIATNNDNDIRYSTKIKIDEADGTKKR